MTREESAKLKSAYVGHVGKYGCNIFATVTLKQGLRICEGIYRRIEDEDMLGIGIIIRDRLRKKLPNRNVGYPFLPFKEKGAFDGRHHLHIIAKMPTTMPLEDYALRFLDSANRSCWTYKIMDIRPIRAGTELNVVNYCLKTGVEAFMPEAAYLPYLD